MIGEGIECVSDDGTVMVVGSSTITATMGMYNAINFCYHDYNIMEVHNY